jgi:PAS domain-containing protein
VGIFTNITAGKRAEEKLQTSEQLFRSIFENANMANSLYGAANLLTNPSTAESGDGKRA